MATENTEILQMHDLKPAPGAKKDRIRVGRGEGSKGKTSGRGDKGTKKRYQVRPGFEGGQLPLYMRLPKLRGFKSPFKKEFQVVNIAALNELYPNGGEITAEDLAVKGAVRKGYPVKVLGDGEATAAFTLKGVAGPAKVEHGRNGCLVGRYSALDSTVRVCFACVRVAHDKGRNPR